MDNLKHIAKREYITLKGLELLIFSLAIIFSLFLIQNYLDSNMIQIASIVKNPLLLYGLLLFSLSLSCIVFIWRAYHIPSPIRRNLVPFFNNLGCSTKNTFPHTLKIFLPSHQSFKIKIKLYQRTSNESCLFYLESDRLFFPSSKQELFKKVAENYFLNSNLHTQKFTTTCELEEIHTRSLLMIRALEDFSREVSPIK
ncbi:MAG: hypothetical protein ACTSYB_07060 [Candidatus Helarchaeota archaeon]